MSTLSRNGREMDALLMFGSMSVRPNGLTLVAALSACSKIGCANVGKSIHGYSLKSVGIGNNIILENAALEMYVGCRDLRSACQMFDVMPERDVVSWTSLLSGYVRNGRYEEAIEVFVSMVRDGEVVPNEATLVCLLGACVLTGGLGLGKGVHSYIFRRYAGVDTVAGNALIDMYAKCGEIHMALKVFDALECRDLVSWGTIIGGMAMNGWVRLVFQLFALMLCHGLRPNGVVFLAVLSACCHAGLVEEGMMFFKSMNKVYGIEPRKEHYSCLIDTFGRTGRLEDAEKLICRMPVEPDGHVWGAFLNACKIYGGCSEGALDRLAKRILGGGLVVGGGTYALLSNLLAKDGKWEESNRVREHMRLKKIRKNAGYSCIEACRS